MLNPNRSMRPSRSIRPASVGPTVSPCPAPLRHRPAAIPDRAAPDSPLEDEDSPVEWSEEEIVFLHWRLLQEVRQLANPATPLEEKFDTLRWVFAEREKDGLPFSFANCLRVVGCSPLSPIAYCGRVDAEEVRDRIRHGLQAWLAATLARYPAWVRDAIVRNPGWVEAKLARNPQWINEEVKRISVQGDLFA